VVEVVEATVLAAGVDCDDEVDEVLVLVRLPDGFAVAPLINRKPPTPRTTATASDPITFGVFVLDDCIELL
jgi:hypothetical protein